MGCSEFAGVGVDWAEAAVFASVDLQGNLGPKRSPMTIFWSLFLHWRHEGHTPLTQVVHAVFTWTVVYHFHLPAPSQKRITTPSFCGHLQCLALGLAIGNFGTCLEPSVGFFDSGCFGFGTKICLAFPLSLNEDTHGKIAEHCLVFALGLYMVIQKHTYMYIYIYTMNHISFVYVYI